MSVKTYLNDELMSELEELGRVEFGSEQYKIGVNGVTQLADRLIEMSKLEQEEMKLDIEEKKVDIEVEKLESENLDRKSKNRISAWGVALPSAIAVVGGLAMFIYEERGSIVSQVGRKIIDKYIFRVK